MKLFPSFLDHEYFIPASCLAFGSIRALTYLRAVIPTAGGLFLEDVSLPQVTFQLSQHVWARQLNDEFSGTKITNNGSLWIMGLKTELSGTVIRTNANAKTELLGALIYPATVVPSTTAAFSSTNASVSYIYAESVYCTSCGYSVQVQETQNGTTRTIQTLPKGNYVMPLFIGIP